MTKTILTIFFWDTVHKWSSYNGSEHIFKYNINVSSRTRPIAIWLQAPTVSTAEN